MGSSNGRRGTLKQLRVKTLRGLRRRGPALTEPVRAIRPGELEPRPPPKLARVGPDGIETKSGPSSIVAPLARRLPGRADGVHPHHGDRGPFRGAGLRWRHRRRERDGAGVHHHAVADPEADKNGRLAPDPVTFFRLYDPTRQQVMPTTNFLTPPRSKVAINVNDDPSLRAEVMLDLNALSTPGHNPWSFRARITRTISSCVSP